MGGPSYRAGGGTAWSAHSITLGVRRPSLHSIMAKRDSPPELVYVERISGSGRLSRADTVVPVIRYILTRRQYDVESEWEFHAFVEKGADERWGRLLAPGPAPISFSGIDEWGGPITVPILHFRKQSGREFEAVAQTVSVGISVLEGACDHQHIRIDLWPTGLDDPEVLYPALYWTGEIKAKRTKSELLRPKVWLRVARHRVRFSKHYTWDDAIVGGQRGIVRIPVARLSGPVHARMRSLSVEQLCDALEPDLDDLARLLTLLSRRHVRWSRIEIATRSRRGDGVEHNTYQRIRGSHSSQRLRETQPLLVPGRMPPGWLEQLLANYRALPAKDSIAGAIIYLTVARDSPFVDGAVANAFTAFEASLNALSRPTSAFSLGSSEFGRLASDVRATVRRFGTEKALPSDTIASISRKIPELRRRPIVDRAVEYLTSKSIDLSGLWPPDVHLSDGLGAMFQRRNHFIHAGELGGIHQASTDAERFIVLTERMLLHALGVSDEWVHPFVRSDSAHLTNVPEPAGE